VRLVDGLLIRASPGTSEIQTASDISAKSASIASEVASEAIAADDQSQLEQPGANAGSPVPSESPRTAMDSSAERSSLSSVHTSPSLHSQHQPTVHLQCPLSIDDQGLFYTTYALDPSAIAITGLDAEFLSAENPLKKFWLAEITK